MKPIFLRFPSQRTFLVIEDMSKAKNNKKAFVFLFNKEALLENFSIPGEALDKGVACFYLAATEAGVKNITQKEGMFYVVLAYDGLLKEFDKNVFPNLESGGKKGFFILSEEPPHKNVSIEIKESISPFFTVCFLNQLFPVSYTPFSYQNLDFPQKEPKKEILSLGNEKNFTIAYLESDSIVVSPNFGELESLYEIDAMDVLVNSIMGHLHFKNLLMVKDTNIYSMISNYTQRFPRVKSVRHVFSHVANSMFDCGFTKEKGIGIVFDSISYDEGDQILGSEIVYGKIGDFDVVGGWKPIPLPGGDIANIEPWRIALAVIKETLKKDFSEIDLPMVKSLQENANYGYIFKAINESLISYSLSSSMHHIIAALGEILFYQESTYDFEFFESRLDRLLLDQKKHEKYSIAIYEEEDKLLADSYQLFESVVSELLKKADPVHLIDKAMMSIASATAELTEKVSRKYNEKKVFLAGEFFKYPHFFALVYQELVKKGLEVHVPKKIPLDDSSISVGQLIYGYFEKG
jgi:hydrogenase maturation protein HypF